MSFEPGEIVEIIKTDGNVSDWLSYKGLRGQIQKQHPRLAGWWLVHYPQRDYVCPLPEDELRKLSAIELLGGLA